MGIRGLAWHVPCHVHCTRCLSFGSSASYVSTTIEPIPKGAMLPWDPKPQWDTVDTVPLRDTVPQLDSVPQWDTVTVPLRDTVPQ
jgi:hypothetical protein